MLQDVQCFSARDIAKNFHVPGYVASDEVIGLCHQDQGQFRQLFHGFCERTVIASVLSQCANIRGIEWRRSPRSPQMMGVLPNE